MCESCESCVFRRPESPDDRWYTCDAIEGRVRVAPEVRTACADYMDGKTEDCPVFSEADAPEDE